jgi:hypothetical protein
VARPLPDNVPLLRAVVRARCWYERVLSGGLESKPAFASEMGMSTIVNLAHSLKLTLWRRASNPRSSRACSGC